MPVNTLSDWSNQTRGHVDGSSGRERGQAGTCQGRLATHRVDPAGESANRQSPGHAAPVACHQSAAKRSAEPMYHLPEPSIAGGVIWRW